MLASLKVFRVVPQCRRYHQAAAELGEDDKRQQAGADAARLHIVRDIGIMGDAAGSFVYEDKGQQFSADESQRIRHALHELKPIRRPWHNLSLRAVRLVDGVGQFLVFLALRAAAKLLDRRQLFIGKVELALEDVSFAQIFTHLRVIGIKRD